MTVNVLDKDGKIVERAKRDGYHAYHASGVTAIEIPDSSKAEARRIAERYGRVLYVFE